MGLKWKALEEVEMAYKANEPILNQKAWSVWLAGLLLLLTAGSLGGYLVFTISA